MLALRFSARCAIIAGILMSVPLVLHVRETKNRLQYYLLIKLRYACDRVGCPVRDIFVRRREEYLLEAVFLQRLIKV